MVTLELLDRASPYSQWSDEKILSTCVYFGEEARKWRNKFLGLLPEIYRRKLYERKGCDSIIEFAYKMGGVSEGQVKNVICLEKRFQETPLLHELLVSGKISMHKMERITSIAEPNNEEFLANQIQLLSRPTLDTLVKDIKRRHTESLACQSLALPTIQETAQVSVQFDHDVAEEIIKLKEIGININDELRKFLEQRKSEIEVGKNICAESEQTRARQRSEQDKKSSRYISAGTKSILKKEHGTICSINGCKKPSKDIHHTQRYSMMKIVSPSDMHDPNFLAPLCKSHHEIAHAIDIKVQERRMRPRR